MAGRSDRKVILVTGAGTGIGRAIAEAAAVAGHTVYASMRGIATRNTARRDELMALAGDRGLDLRVIELDVLSEVSCRSAVDQILLDVDFHRELIRD